MEIDLEYSLSDAQSMAKLLGECCNFPEQNVQYLANSTFCDIAQAFATLDDGVAQERAEFPDCDQLVVVYYSGHGIRVKDSSGDEDDDLDGAIIPVDTKEDLDLVITDDHLGFWLDQLGAARIVVISDCANVGAKGLAHDGRLVLAASTKAGKAWENPSLGHEVFSHYLLEGLNKGDDNGDVQVSLQEAFQHAQVRVTQFIREAKGTHVQQEPQIADGIGEPIFLGECFAECAPLEKLKRTEPGGTTAK